MKYIFFSKEKVKYRLSKQTRYIRPIQIGEFEADGNYFSLEMISNRRGNSSNGDVIKSGQMEEIENGKQLFFFFFKFQA